MSRARLQQLLVAKVFATRKRPMLLAYRGTVNPAALARESAAIRAELLMLARDKTERVLPRQTAEAATRAGHRYNSPSGMISVAVLACFFI